MRFAIFVPLGLVLHFLAWVITGVAFGDGLAIASRFSWSNWVFNVVTVVTAGLILRFWPKGAGWLAAAAFAVIVSVGGLMWNEMIVSIPLTNLIAACLIQVWEWFWPIAAAAAGSERILAHFASST